MATKPVPVEDNFELKASKAMGVMEEGDAVFGSGAEVNLDSQVPCHFSFSLCFHTWIAYTTFFYCDLNPFDQKTCRFIGGMINIVQENQNTSIGFIQDTSGTSTTRLTMIMTIHLQRLCKDISLTSSIQTLLTRQKLQLTPSKRMETAARHVS